MAGWEEIVGAVSTTLSEVGGIWANRISKLFKGENIAGTDTTLAPVIGTKWSFVRDKLHFLTTDLSKTTQLLGPATVDVNKVINIPQLQVGLNVDDMVTRQAIQEFIGKIWDINLNVITDTTGGLTIGDVLTWDGTEYKGETPAVGGGGTTTPSTVTFYINKLGASFQAVDSLGAVVQSNTLARTLVQWAIDNLPVDGGLILLAPNVTFDLGSPAANGLIITQSATKRVNLIGSGMSTKIQYTGTGYAIEIVGSLSDSQSFRVGNFLIDGSTKTTGRHGILDQSRGPTGFYTDLYIRNMDESFRIINSNTRFIDRLQIKTANIGLITSQGVDSAVNVIHLNHFTISNCATVGIHLGIPYAGPTESGSVSCSIKDGNIDACLLAIQLSGLAHNTTIQDVYIETGTGTHDIYVKGANNTFPVNNLTLTNVRGSGLANSPANMIKFDYCREVTLNNVKAVSYTDSMIYLNQDATYKFVIINPHLESTPFLINSVTLTNNRNLGTVIDAGRIGFIGIISNASSVAGDVAIIASTNRYSKTTIADNNRPAVIMYGNVATGDRPAVFCMKGITPVNIDSAAAVGDTITTSVTSGKAKINNAAIDPKIVIGYVNKTLASTGLTDVRIL